MRNRIVGGVVLLLATACGSDSTGGFTATGGSGGAATGGSPSGGGGGSGGINVGGTGGGINIGGAAGTATGGTGGGTQDCVMGTKACSGNIPQICGPGNKWISNPACPFVCAAGNCVGKCAPGTNQCKLGKTQTCDNTGQWGPKTDCEFGCDPTGVCKAACTAGSFKCNGNEVLQCNPGPPAKWVPKSPATICNASSGQICSAATGTCTAATTIGGTTPTSKYYQYAIFQSGSSAFLGGGDVTSWGDYVYATRSSQYIDVYKITLLDSDGDGKLEPNQHPDNPKHTGPIEQRTIQFVKTYAKSGEGAPVYSTTVSGLLSTSNNDIYSVGPSHNGSITLYDFASKTSTVPFMPTSTTLAMSFLGYAHDEKLFYGGNESYRRVYSFHVPTKAWVLEFQYPNLAGSHMDGIEAVVSPKTGQQFVYVSDMTTDFIGQYRRDDAQGWVQEALFEYNDATKSMLEGFGFGTLNHFWATSGSGHLYELGGGDIQEDLEPCPDNKAACGGTQPACQGTDVCLDGCCYPNTCPGGAQICGGGMPACPSGQVCQGGCCANQCPAGKQACGTGLPACPTSKYCVAGCCSDQPQ